MNITSCQIMRRLMMTALILMAIGLLAFASSQVLAFALPDIVSLSVSYLGLIFIMISPIVLVVNLLMALLPGSRQRLEHCNH